MISDSLEIFMLFEKDIKVLRKSSFPSPLAPISYAQVAMRADR